MFDEIITLLFLFQALLPAQNVVKLYKASWGEKIMLTSLSLSL